MLDIVSIRINSSGCFHLSITLVFNKALTVMQLGALMLLILTQQTLLALSTVCSRLQPLLMGHLVSDAPKQTEMPSAKCPKHMCLIGIYRRHLTSNTMSYAYGRIFTCPFIRLEIFKHTIIYIN